MKTTVTLTPFCVLGVFRLFNPVLSVYEKFISYQNKKRYSAQHEPAAHLNLVACVSTVMENPSTPEVFLQVGYTWYLDGMRRCMFVQTFVLLSDDLWGVKMSDTDPRVSFVLRKSKHGSSMCICGRKSNESEAHMQQQECCVFQHSPPSAPSERVL